MMKPERLLSVTRSLRAIATVSAATLVVPALLTSMASARGIALTARGVMFIHSGAAPETSHSSRLHHVSAGHAAEPVPAHTSSKAHAEPARHQAASRPEPKSTKPQAKSESKPTKPDAKKQSGKPQTTRPQAKSRRKHRPNDDDNPDPIPVVRVGAKSAPARPIPTHSAAREVPVPPRIPVHSAMPPAPTHPIPATTATAMPEVVYGTSRPDAAEPTVTDTDRVAEVEQPAAPIVREPTGDSTIEAALPATAAMPLEAELDPDAAFVSGRIVTHQPELEFTTRGRVVMPAPLRGSHDVLVHQNLMADDEHLSRIQDDEQLNYLIAHRQLVDFPDTPGLTVNGALPGERRVARAWTVRFATDMAHNFYERFHSSLIVSSAVRTVAYQLHLERINGNAAGIEGEGASPHLTGQAIDIAKHGMTQAEIAWMRSYLLPLMQAGKIDVEEEFKQACFHISVYKSYLPAKKAPRTQVAQVLPAGDN